MTPSTGRERCTKRCNLWSYERKLLASSICQLLNAPGMNGYNKLKSHGIVTSISIDGFSHYNFNFFFTKYCLSQIYSQNFSFILKIFTFYFLKMHTCFSKKETTIHIHIQGEIIAMVSQPNVRVFVTVQYIKSHCIWKQDKHAVNQINIYNSPQATKQVV